MNTSNPNNLRSHYCIEKAGYPTLQSVSINDVIRSDLSLHTMKQQSILSYNTDHNLSTFKLAVKEHLFPVFKFCTSPKDLVFSVQPNSVCQIVMRHVGIQPEQQEDCWNTYQHHVRSDLSRKRNNVVGQLRKKFQGKHCAENSLYCMRYLLLS